MCVCSRQYNQQIKFYFCNKNSALKELKIIIQGNKSYSQMKNENKCTSN